MGKKRLKPPSKMRQPLLTFIINNLPASALYHHTTCHAENRLIFSAGWMGGRAQYRLAPVKLESVLLLNASSQVSAGQHEAGALAVLPSSHVSHVSHAPSSLPAMLTVLSIVLSLFCLFLLRPLLNLRRVARDVGFVCLQS
jgi:hypothetical protein